MGDLIDWLVVILVFGGSLFGIAMSGLFWLLDRAPRRPDVSSVSDSPPDGGDAVMSRSTSSAAPSGPSVSETDGQTAETDRADDALRAKKLLPLYALLRRADIPREVARAALEASGLPLNNNVWTAAAPADPAGEPPRAIGIVHNGERIVAALPPRRGPYYPDAPALEYQEPPPAPRRSAPAGDEP